MRPGWKTLTRKGRSLDLDLPGWAVDVWLVNLKVGLRALKWGIQSRCRKGHRTFTGRV